MLDIKDIMETVTMIQDDHLDIRTITMGISLLDCANSDIGNSCNKIYEKICRKAENLVAAGEEIEKKYGIPIVNKRIITQIDGNYLSPKLQGNKLGISPFWIMFAIIVFGSLFGIIGFFIGVPVFYVIYVLF